MHRILILVLTIAICAQFVRAEMKMHVIDVGQAESILFEFENHAILLDAGTQTAPDDRYEKQLFSYLEAFFARRTDLNRTIHTVIVSHPHKDHTRNLVDVFQKYTVKFFLEGGGKPNSSGMADIRRIREQIVNGGATEHQILKAQRIKRKSFLRSWRKDLVDNSRVEIRFLSAGRSCNNENNASLVFRVEHLGRSFLLTGDSEVSDKEHGNNGCGGLVYRLLNKRASYPHLLNVDVYKVGHHGSSNGTADILLSKIKPQYSVISAGHSEVRFPNIWNAWNFGHPRESIITLLEQWTQNLRPSKVFVTTMQGSKNPIKNRPLEKAIYSTSWDNNIVFTVTNNSELSVDTTQN